MIKCYYLIKKTPATCNKLKKWIPSFACVVKQLYHGDNNSKCCSVYEHLQKEPVANKYCEISLCIF